MTVQILPMTDGQAAKAAAPLDDGGLGCLRTDRGNLPLAAVDVKADITGLVYRVELTQQFVNPHGEPLEATYVFPLPDRAAVTGMRMTAADTVIEARLEERAAARDTYDRALAAGQRASIAEEERPDVFTMRVGNIVPGEQVTVTLTMAGPLATADGAATFRFPLVVAPRYIPGTPLGDAPAGDGYAADTDAVPDASRITPPVLLPGFPNPVRLGIDVGIDPAGLPLADVRSSLHTVALDGDRWRVAPGERANRDFVLRLAYGAEQTASALALHRDPDGDEGTFELTVLPPAGAATQRPRDVVLLLDRSGSMTGWKMVAARRAAARIVDTLTDADRFAVVTFDHAVDRPEGLPAGLVEATDRNRFRAVRHLSGVDARGGTELLEPLRAGRALLTGGTDAERDRVLVLVTDGQVGNEDQILAEVGDLHRLRVHTVGIDRAVNAGFLQRLAGAGGGTCELVESEDRLDEVMAQLNRRIGAPLITDLTLVPAGLSVLTGTVAPARLPDLFPGVPVVIRGRYTGTGGGLAVRGVGFGGQWRADLDGVARDNSAATAIWARAHLRDLEDAYAVSGGRGDLETRIVAASLRFGVLCRFTAYVAVDPRVVAEGGPTHRIVQPVEAVDGWDMPVPMARGFAPAGTAPKMMARMSFPTSVRQAPPAPAAYGAPPAPAGSPPAPGPTPQAPLDRTAVDWGRAAVPPGSPVPAFGPPPTHPAPGDAPGRPTPGVSPLPPPTVGPDEADRIRHRIGGELAGWLEVLRAGRHGAGDELVDRFRAWLGHAAKELETTGSMPSAVADILSQKVAAVPAGSSDDRWAAALDLAEFVQRNVTLPVVPPVPPAPAPPAPAVRRAFWKRGG